MGSFAKLHRSCRPAAWVPWAILATALGMAGAYDLTPDRGAIAGVLKTSNSYVAFNVWNVGSNDWGPFDNCGTTWADAQWRSEFGKRIGTVVPKTVIYQTDFNPITNGWFTPNPSRPYAGCTGSHISRGWDDEYSNSIPSTSSISTTSKPTLLVKIDPALVNTADENLNNNRVWVTTQWNASTMVFEPIETMDLPAGSTVLASGDSLFYGPYSTTSSLGRIYITNKGRTNALSNGNQMLGYQGRQMVVNVTGTTSQNVYTIQYGSKVQADFLGQNHY